MDPDTSVIADKPQCDLELAHAIGVYPLGVRDSVVALGDDAVAFPIGRQVAVWDHVKNNLQFLPRRQDNCVITAMAKSPSGRLLAVAERQGSSNDKREVGNVQITIVGLPSAYAPLPTPEEDGTPGTSREGVLKVLYPSNKKSKIVDLAFTADGRHLVTISDMPEATIVYWRWEAEKAVSTHDIQLPITRLQVNPKNGAQVSLSGYNYMRIWEYNANDHNLHENASVFALKVEKQKDILDHCWYAMKEESILCVVDGDGYVHLFKDGEKLQEIMVQEQIVKDESTGPIAQEKERQQNLARIMGTTAPTTSTDKPVTLISLGVWGQGFLVGGDQGYLGLFKFNAQCRAEPHGTFRMPGHQNRLWCMSVGTEDTYLNILSYVEKDAEDDAVPRNRRAPTTSPKHELRKSVTVSMVPENPEPEDDEKDKQWSITAFSISQSTLDPTQVEFRSIVPLGFHNAAITGTASCPSRNLLATCSEDKFLKLWNYPHEDGIYLPNAFSSEFSTQVSVYEKPSRVALHPLGFQVAIVLETQLAIYHVTTQQASRIVMVLPLKYPGDVAYSHGGELLAVSTNQDVCLIDPLKGVLVRMFAGIGGHTSYVNRVAFSADDKILLSCSAASSGAIYGWDLESEAKDRIFEHVSKGTDYMAFAHDFRRNLVCAIANPQGSMRMIGHLSTTAEEIMPETPNVAYTALTLAAPIGYLFAGTQHGCVRIFRWPLKPGGAEENVFVQVELHAHAITSLSLSSSSAFLFSSCRGGSVLASRIKAEAFVDETTIIMGSAELDQRIAKFRRREDSEKKRKVNKEVERKAVDLQKKLFEALASSASNIATLDDMVMLPKNYFHETLQEISNLEEKLQCMKHESEFALEQKEAEVSEKLQIMRNERKCEHDQLDEKYDSLFNDHKNALQRHAQKMKTGQEEFEALAKKITDSHDSNMATEYEKQSLLFSELQSLKESHAKHILEVNDKHSQQLESLRTTNESALKDWRAEYDKVCNLLKSDGLKFEEAMRQQESEYEEQISEILELKRAVLQVESEKSTTALKDSVSMKQTISILQGHIVDYKAKLEDSDKQRQELQKQLEVSREMFANVQEQLKEEKRALKVKNENLAKIREQMKHLESFRFVLFHKVKQMEEERDPLAEQVASLKSNVRDMYTEFVHEFRSKQKVDQQLSDKTVLTNSLQQENVGLTRHLIQLKKDGRRLLTDVEQVLHPDTEAEFERLPKRLMVVLEKYQNLKDWQPPPDEQNKTLDVDPTKEQAQMSEMVIQRDLLFRKNRIATTHSTQIKRDCALDLRRLRSENAALIAEMNTLRTENRSLFRSCKEQEAAIISYKAQEKAKRAISEAASVPVARSESAPQLDCGSGGPGTPGGGIAANSGSTGRRGFLRGGSTSGSAGGSAGGTVGSETPYVKRKVVDQQESQRRYRTKGKHQLPPVIQQSYDVPGSSTPPRGSQDSFSVQRTLEREGYDLSRLAAEAPECDD